MRNVFSAPTALFADLGLTATCLLLLGGTIQAQELKDQVAAVLGQAESVAAAEIYPLADELADVAPDRNLDGYRTAIMATAGQSDSSRQRLCAALAFAQLKEDSTFGKDLIALLDPVVAKADEFERSAALSILGEERLYNTRMLTKVRKLVREQCENELVSPRVRIEAALSLWKVGTNKDLETAKGVLEQFLQSTDRDLQQRGALALAEINTEGGKAWQILRDIRDQPTDAGRRAALFLKQSEQRREWDAQLRAVMKRMGPGKTDTSDDYAVLDELRHRIRIQHIRGSELSNEELVEYAAKGMLQGLDPHSTFFTSQEFQRFYFDLNREYGGIGAFVNFDQDGDFSIVRPIYSGPAYAGGLRSGDKILEIDGWETNGYESEEIIKRLKGRPDTPVVLKFFRLGFQEPQELTITRRQISVPAVNYAMVPGDVGYIELINFSANISDELQVALRDLVSKGAKGIVLDVRNNTGGFLTQARDVVEQFIKGKELVVYTEGPNEPRRSYSTDPRRRQVCELPLVVLTNRLSASASEIVAGAFQDLERATVIGKRSFGKGSVQNMFPLATSPQEKFTDLNGDRAWQEGEPFEDRNGNDIYDPGAHIKLTVAKYYLPSGRCPHREFNKEGRIVDPAWGVRPDIEIELLENKPEDAWKNSAVYAILKTAKIREYVKAGIEKDQALFRQLAEGDDGDPQRYPGFDDFFEGLDTKLSKDDVRRWTRYEVRDQISDLRGAVYPGQRALGDAQEDAQLQEAIRVLMKAEGRDIRDVTALKNVFKIDFDGKETAKAAESSK